MTRDKSPAAPAEPQVLQHFRDIAGDYAGILCDIWGVVHNGVQAWPDACETLSRFRAGGGRVVLITNAPRPSGPIRAMLDRLDVPREAYDAIVSSGDLTHTILGRRSGARAYHIGPERDLGVFEGADIALVGPEEADLVVNTGLFDDDTESPEDYRRVLEALRARDVEMVCANPDVVVERGDRLVYCAGALADLYEEMGGKVHWAGKPHPLIYETAVGLLEQAAGRSIERSAILAVGDSLRTDMAGAARSGLDALFIAAGIHGEELTRAGALDLVSLEESFRRAGVWPRAVMRQLVW